MSVGLRHLLWRQRNVFSVRLLFASIVLAVFTVTTILSVSESLQQNLYTASSDFLAADRQIRSPRPLDEEILKQADVLGLQRAASVEFSTMLSAVREASKSPTFQLVSVKAVDGRYPLKGQLELGSERLSDAKQPNLDGLWMESRLYARLGVSEGDSLRLGAHQFALETSLLKEPDASFQLAGFAPRVMIRLDQLEQTEVVRPGSRVTYRYYFTGDDEALESYGAWLETRLVNSQRWIGVREGRPAIAEALDKADRYLLLGASLAVMLAALAIAIASRQFTQEQARNVAVIKALGGTGKQIFLRYCYDLAVLGLLAVLVGLVLGGISSNLWLSFIAAHSEYIERHVWVLPSMYGVFLALVTCVLMVSAFALPQLNALRHTPSMRVLREEGSDAGNTGRLALGFALVGMSVLLMIYAREPVLVLAMTGGVGILCLLAATFSSLLLSAVVKPLLGRMALGSALRHSLQAMLRRKRYTLVQLSIFSVAIFLFASLLLVRTGLVDQWQAQLPEDAPNHFLINVAPYDLEALSQELNSSSLKTSGLYPMVRGRLSHINGVDVKIAVTKEQDIGALNRELNLTWSDQVPVDNEIVEGSWWGGADKDVGNVVSIEAELAQRLGVQLGDRLRFNIAGSDLEVEISNIRTVQWDSMRPNFYMMFPPDLLDENSATYITSFYLPVERKEVLNKLSERFPTVSILELDQLIEKIRTIVAQVSVMVELLLVFVLVAALLVLAALVSASRSERIHESVLLRTLGASQMNIYKIQVFEFFVIGLVAGVLATLGAELSVWLLREQLFSGGFVPRVDVWVAVPLVSGLVIAVFAYFQTREIPRVAPIKILRDL